MVAEIKYTQLVDYLGLNPISAVLHDDSRRTLTERLELYLPVNLPDSNPISHEAYERTLKDLRDCSTMAALSGSNQLEVLMRQLVELQERYAKQVIGKIKEGIGDQNKLLAEKEKELAAGEPDRAKYSAMSKKPIGEMKAREIEEFGRLRGIVEKLDETLEFKDRLKKAIDGVSSAETTLTSLIVSGIESIHYSIPSLNTIQDRLGKDEYNGPDFNPFVVSASARVNDLFNRGIEKVKEIKVGDGVRVSSVNDLEPLLGELIKVYEHVINQVPGSKIVPAKLRDELKIENIGAKGLGSYFEENQDVFGVVKIDAPGSRTFTRKETGKILSKEEFLGYMLNGKLQGPDAQQVNEYYLQKTLAVLRDTPGGYMGFTKDEANAIARKNCFYVSPIFLSRNLNNEKREDLGVEFSEEEKGRFYRFSKVVPTELQLRYVAEAIPQLGINRFTPADLLDRIHENHSDYRTAEIVVCHILIEKHKEYGLRVASDDPVEYQKIGETVSAAERRRPRTDRRIM